MKTKTTFLSIAFIVLATYNFTFAQKTIAGGSFFSFAVCNDGTVKGWGLNGNGRLGNGTSTDSNVPVAVSTITDVIQVSSGNDHGVALKSDSTVWCWGRNQEGRLGNGTTSDATVPVQASNLTGVISIATGGRHTLALKKDGTVWSFGYNNSGELGIGSFTDSNVPVQVSTLTGITAIASMGINSVALKSDGTVWTWGDNATGQLGNGNTGTDSNVPVQVSGLTGIVAISGGGYHSLALKSDGTVWAWGYNGYGRLGNGTNTTSNIPVQVSTITGIVSLAAGANGHSLFLKNDGTVWACGGNINGELGNGTNTSSNVPVQVSSLTGIVAIAGGFTHSLFLKNDGTLWACGANLYGEIGNATNVSSNVPVQVSGLCVVPASVNETIKQASFSVFPNPTNGIFQITGNNINVTNVEIYNAIGEKVFQKTDANKVDMSGSSKGIYFVKIYDGEAVYTQKIVVE